MPPRTVVLLYGLLAEGTQSSVKLNINEIKWSPTDERAHPDIHVHRFNAWLIKETYFRVVFILCLPRDEPKCIYMSPPPEVRFGGEPCGSFCLLFSGSEEFLRTGFFWPRLHVTRTFRTEIRCELTVLRIWQTNGRKWTVWTHISPWFVPVRLFPACLCASAYGCGFVNHDSLLWNEGSGASSFLCRTERFSGETERGSVQAE